MIKMSREDRLARAEECLASGMTVKATCAATGVPAPTMCLCVERLREDWECELVPECV